MPNQPDKKAKDKPARDLAAEIARERDSIARLQQRIKNILKAGDAKRNNQNPNDAVS
jgi:hypothetical protein